MPVKDNIATVIKYYKFAKLSHFASDFLLKPQTLPRMSSGNGSCYRTI